MCVSLQLQEREDEVQDNKYCEWTLSLFNRLETMSLVENTEILLAWCACLPPIVSVSAHHGTTAQISSPTTRPGPNITNALRNNYSFHRPRSIHGDQVPKAHSLAFAISLPSLRFHLYSKAMVYWDVINPKESMWTFIDFLLGKASNKHLLWDIRWEAYEDSIEELYWLATIWKPHVNTATEKKDHINECVHGGRMPGSWEERYDRMAEAFYDLVEEKKLEEEE
ncbi:hypothetical protein IWX90DRAFT_415372 [Phyllosticta citrichinensis]|uniref:Uncharacterized protein n=1 Tax=Phyllosticta citrichinensis TaxID=1130410 RepID=A0ABR1XUW9_9PEZI